MKTQEIRDYVKILCDAENALYACDEAITMIENKRDGLKYPPELQRPKYTVVEKEKGSKMDVFKGSVSVTAFLGGFAGVAYLIYDIMLHGGRNALPKGVIGAIIIGILAFVLIAIIGVLVGGILGIILSPIVMIVDSKIKGKKQKKTQMEVDSQYEYESDSYEKALSLRRNQISSVDKARAILSNQIDEQRAIRYRISQKLQDLYMQDIIHPNYRNIVAINQINDYLQTGICDTLEGANGAYALYMQDVRAERICSSIQDLKESLEKSFSRMTGMMASLTREMRENNMRISQIGCTISDGFNQIESSIREADANQSRSREELNRANRHLEELEKALRTSAHNEYVALREANLDKYNRMRKP